MGHARARACEIFREFVDVPCRYLLVLSILRSSVKFYAIELIGGARQLSRETTSWRYAMNALASNESSRVLIKRKERTGISSARR